MSDGLIPEETRAQIGQPMGGPERGEVLRKECERFAHAVDDLNPLYFDEEYAKAAGYDGVIAPPMFFNVALTGSRPLSETRTDGLFRSSQRELRFNGVNRSMFGGEDIEFLAPIYPGDVLEAEAVWEDIEEKHGSTGDFVVTRWKRTVRNQRGEVVAISRGSGIVR